MAEKNEAKSAAEGLHSKEDSLRPRLLGLLKTTLRRTNSDGEVDTGFQNHAIIIDADGQLALLSTKPTLKDGAEHPASLLDADQQSEVYNDHTSTAYTAKTTLESQIKSVNCLINVSFTDDSRVRLHLQDGKKLTFSIVQLAQLLAQNSTEGSRVFYFDLPSNTEGQRTAKQFNQEDSVFAVLPYTSGENKEEVILHIGPLGEQNYDPNHLFTIPDSISLLDKIIEGIEGQLDSQSRNF